MGEGLKLMSEKEVGRLDVVKRAMGGELSQAQAAQLMGVTVRQVKRLVRRYREQGTRGLISHKRGRASNRRIDTAERERYVQLVGEHYADFGPQLAHEYLQREHGFARSVETLRGWMVQAGLWQVKRRRAQRVHHPRQRRECLGELVQIDGSHHDWFEGRSAKCCLIAFIDDATGRVLGAQFFEQETTQGYLEVLQTLVQRLGAPLALFSDRHSIFTKANAEDARPTQFERALLQLDIEPICAHSPQAKGRVERLFQTLQDRMCKAMRLQGIDTLKQANSWVHEYLREHNRRFAVQPRQPQDVLRPWQGSSEALADICSLHHQRQLSAQGACKFEGAILQLMPNQAHAPKARAMVNIAQHRDGSLRLSYQGKELAFRSFAMHQCARTGQMADDKTINLRVDKLLATHQQKLLRLQAELAFQDSQRQRGIYRPDTPNAITLAGAGRYGLRPPRPAPAPG
jgi:transposase